jgi:hypothetical protein
MLRIYSIEHIRVKGYTGARPVEICGKLGMFQKGKNENKSWY